jgi:DNA-directed RNA polymerase subunit F
VRKGIVYARADSAALEFETQTADHLPAWVKYLLAFDVKYRERRLQFLIEGQNRLYQLLGQERFAGFNPIAIDRLKREFYARLDALRQRERAAFYSDEVRALVADIVPAEPSSGEAKHLAAFASRFVELNADKLDRLIERLAVEVDLDGKTRELDDLLASLDPKEWHPEARREVLINYLGFPFWDVLTFPITSGRPFGELNEILIDRISPQDAHALKGFDGSDSLKGAGFGHFAAFFSRAYRENDYLLGRLHALDRLIDIVCDAAGIEPKTGAIKPGGIDVLALKKRGFARILDVEERHLTHSKQLIASLRQRVDELGVDELGVDELGVDELGA